MQIRASRFAFSLFTSSLPKSYYEVLGLQRSATLKDIKMKYIELVKQYHPDHNPDPGAAEKFKDVVKAYQTLKDPIKRQLYDSDPLNFDSSGTAASANEMNSEKYSYYSNKKNKEYYENRWYQYQKPNYETLHDEQKTKYEAIDEFGTKAILVRAGVIIGLYIAWDVYRFVQRKRHDRFLQTQKEILDAQLVESPIELYIDQRQADHALEQ